MKILIIENGQEPREADIENTLQAMHTVVGGYIETVRLNHNTILVCNEEGKLIGLTPNRRIGKDIICGTFFIAGSDAEDFRDLTFKQIQQYTAFFRISA